MDKRPGIVVKLLYLDVVTDKVVNRCTDQTRKLEADDQWQNCEAVLRHGAHYESTIQTSCRSMRLKRRA